MTHRGRVRNGVVLLDEPAALPDGAVVDVRVVGGATEGEPPRPSSVSATIEERLAALWAAVPDSEWAKLPEDLTDHLDHYIYGMAKK